MNFDEMSDEISSQLINDNNVLVYAFNATGKTRLSKKITEKYPVDENGNVKCLCYNAFLEDDFTWDNDSLVFSFESSIITRYLKDEGLDGEVVDAFRKTIGLNIEPKIDFENCIVEFVVPTGDDNSVENIKISKGEETIFKWVLFLVVLRSAIELLKDKKDNRSTELFDELKCVIIDDPVSSIDDYRIYTVVCQIIEIINEIKNYNANSSDKINVSFLISSHHALFFNILSNFFISKRKPTSFFVYVLKRKNDDYQLDKVGNTNGNFSYHKTVIEEINEAINNNSLQKKHFNLFRSLLEKTTVFLCFNNWENLFEKYDDLERIKRMLNSNSHGRFSDVEMNELEEEQKEVFTNAFNWFINVYHFQVK